MPATATFTPPPLDSYEGDAPEDQGKSAPKIASPVLKTPVPSTSTSSAVPVPNAAPATAGKFTPPPLDSYEGDAPEDKTVGSAAHRAVSNYWAQVNPVAQVKALSDTVHVLATHPLQTLSKIGEQNDAPRLRAIEDYKKGDYTSAVGHGLDWLMNAIPGVGSTVMKASDQWENGDRAGALGTFGGLATNLILLPKMVAKGLSVATEPDIVSNAAQSVKDVAGAVKTGVKAAAPKVTGGAAMIAAGKGVSEVPGFEWPARLALEYPGLHLALKGVKQGIASMVGDLALRRAAAAEANAAANQSARALADEINPLPPERQLPPGPSRVLVTPPGEADTSGSIPTDPVTGRPLPMGPAPLTGPPAEPTPLPESHQLAAPSGPPPIIAGPVAPPPPPGNIDYTPPDIPAEASGIIPTDRVTGRPIRDAAPLAGADTLASENAKPTPVANVPKTQELADLDTIAKSIYGDKFNEIKPVPHQTVSQRQEFIRRVYNDMHAGKSGSLGANQSVAPPEPAPVPAPTPEAASPEPTAPTIPPAPDPATEAPVAPVPPPEATTPIAPPTPPTGPSIITQDELPVIAATRYGGDIDAARKDLGSKGTIILSDKEAHFNLMGAARDAGYITGKGSNADTSLLKNLIKSQGIDKTSIADLTPSEKLRMWKLIKSGNIGESNATTASPNSGGVPGATGEPVQGLPSAQTVPQGSNAAEASPGTGQSAGPSKVPGQGVSTEILIPGTGASFPATYRVREMSEITPSHNGATFAPNSKYAYENERDYRNPNNQGKVINGASMFKPSWHITDNPDATNGPPLVTPDGMVLGGNGRTMMLQRVNRYYPGSSAAYKQMLIDKATQYGLDPQQIAGMKEPVLTREIPNEKVTDVQNAINDFNKTGTAALTPAEQAISDSRRVSQSTLDDISKRLDAAGDDATLNDVLKGKAGGEVLNKLIDDGVLTSQQRAAYANEDILTKSGQERISKLLLGRFFRDPAQLDNVPAIVKNKLERIAAPMAATEEYGEWSLAPRIQQALDLIEEARVRKFPLNSLDNFINQPNFENRFPYTKDAVEMAKLLQKAPQKLLVDAISHYTEEARHYGQGPGLFEETKDPEVSFKESLDYAAKQAEIAKKAASEKAAKKQAASQ